MQTVSHLHYRKADPAVLGVDQSQSKADTARYLVSDVSVSCVNVKHTSCSGAWRQLFLLTCVLL
jgi:hypothetical protein